MRIFGKRTTPVSAQKTFDFDRQELTAADEKPSRENLQPSASRELIKSKDIDFESLGIHREMFDTCRIRLEAALTGSTELRQKISAALDTLKVPQHAVAKSDNNQILLDKWHEWLDRNDKQLLYSLTHAMYRALDKIGPQNQSLEECGDRILNAVNFVGIEAVLSGNRAAERYRHTGLEVRDWRMAEEHIACAQACMAVSDIVLDNIYKGNSERRAEFMPRIKEIQELANKQVTDIEGDNLSHLAIYRKRFHS